MISWDALFQIPPYISKNMKFLGNALKQMNTEKINVMEFRDISWFQKEVYDLLSENNVGFCTVSATNLPDDLINTSGIVYIRFHGLGDTNNRYQHLYSNIELDEWKQKIQNTEANKIFCYFNNDYNANAVKNCKELKKMLN